jgi:hypothetical protein
LSPPRWCRFRGDLTYEGGSSTKPIDFHAHIYTDEMAPKAIASVKRRMGVRVPGLGTVADLQDSMVKAGVEKSIILPLAPLPKHVRPTNEFFLAAADGDGLVPFGAIHPFQSDLEEELDRLLAAGSGESRPSPFLQGFYPDDPRCDRLYEGWRSGDGPPPPRRKVPEDLPSSSGPPTASPGWQSGIQTSSSSSRTWGVGDVVCRPQIPHPGGGERLLRHRLHLAEFDLGGGL